MSFDARARAEHDGDAIPRCRKVHIYGDSSNAPAYFGPRRLARFEDEAGAEAVIEGLDVRLLFRPDPMRAGLYIVHALLPRAA